LHLGSGVVSVCGALQSLGSGDDDITHCLVVLVGERQPERPLHPGTLS